MRPPSSLTALLSVRKRTLEEAKATLRARAAELTAAQQARDGCGARLADLRAVNSPAPQQYEDVRDMRAAEVYERRNAARVEACQRELAQLEDALSHAERSHQAAVTAVQQANSALQTVERKLQEQATQAARSIRAREEEELDELHALGTRGRDTEG